MSLKFVIWKEREGGKYFYKKSYTMLSVLLGSDQTKRDPESCFHSREPKPLFIYCHKKLNALKYRYGYISRY